MENIIDEHISKLYMVYNDLWMLYSDNDILTDEMCFVPTLEELIEACKKTHESNGYTFDFVINYVNSEEPYWFAGYEYMDGWCEGEDGQGATPTEAVANLWLALNKKVGG